MPYYFAYGANMDAVAMARRCPASRPVGVARLPRRRLFITSDGYASIERAPRDAVYGVLWTLALADVRPLDRFEGVERGLYRKTFAPVIMGRGRIVRAMIYVASATTAGAPAPGYVDAILAAADQWPIPPAHRAAIAALGAGRPARAGPAFRN